MIALQNIGVEFGGRKLFKDISWNIGDEDRVGLIGANGTGKTTLLRIIAGHVNPDEGDIIKSKDCSIGYLPQESITFSGRTLHNEMMSVFESVQTLIDTKEAIATKFSKLEAGSEESIRLLKEYGEIEEKMDKIGGYTLEHRVEKVLSGLGFDKKDWDKQTETFSGGWEMRIALGKLILQNPNYLLLDEPTNFLDLDSIIWLENHLKNFTGSIICVSHDRYFMDKLVKKVVEIEFGQLNSYSTNYSGCIKEKEKRRELILKAYEERQAEVERIELFIAKFRANASKAKLVKSRERMLEKMDEIVVPTSAKKVKFVFYPSARAGDKVMELKGMGLAYGTKKVFENLNFLITRGEKIAVVGVNGAGKTTLAKVIAGALEPTAGERKVGANVHIGYFAQKTLDLLNPKNTVLEELQTAAPMAQEGRLRTFLGSFLFSGDDVFKLVKVLSGGEKTRLAMAKILISPVNFLILDEPTNHLDITGREVLEEALRLYDGTIVLVTHDRAVINCIANKVIEVADGVIKTHIGNYNDYIAEKFGITEKKGKKAGDGRLQLPTNTKPEPEKWRKPESLPQRRARIEKVVDVKEKRIAAIEKLFLEPGIYSNAYKLNPLKTEYDALKEEIEKLYAEWEGGE
ncbi:MAG: ABC-F family ATP-binding cassette domain-containing protein [bacterium]